MKLINLTNEPKIKERIEYIYNCFLKSFPNARIQERPSIIGIGEEGRRLLCYLKVEQDGTKVIKFKSSFPIDILSDKNVIDEHIKMTTQLFNSNNFKTKKPRKKVLFEVEKEENIYQEKINAVSKIFDYCELEWMLFKKLAIILKSNGINTIQDLRRFTLKDLLKIKGVSLKRYKYLLEMVEGLSKANIANVPNKKYKYLGGLYVVKTDEIFGKLETCEEINEYLQSINYNENLFETNTMGKFLCLRYNMLNFNFFKLSCDNINKQAFLEKQDFFKDYHNKLKEFFYNLLKMVLSSERDLLVVSKLLGLFDKHCTLEQVGQEYNVTRERVRQIFNKSINLIKRMYVDTTEQGLLKKLEQFKILKEISLVGIDLFLLYLKLNSNVSFNKIVREVLLDGIIIPDLYFYNLDIISKEILTEQKQKNEKIVQNNQVKYKNFTLIVDENGKVLTDVNLLIKLRAQRYDLAITHNVSAFIVYRNTQLVALATYKPTCKAEYLKLAGFSEKSWNNYGDIMVSIIKKHIEKQSKTTI